ncbi:hypothetical protein [Microvirga sp. 2TAF3]|uniref:hypothetical protein n=1 Tax=Microvirga sp. 2TAF3 TaxID=3233014 RepID=UPI003F981A96
MRIDIVDNEVENMLDGSFQLRTDKVLERGWHTIPFVNLPSALEAEWLSNVIRSKMPTQCRAVYFEFDRPRSIEEIIPNRDTILNCFHRHSHEYLLIYNANLDFLIYKEQYNRYYIVAGDAKFLAGARPYSSSTHEIIFRQWMEDPIFSEPERLFMLRIWEKYGLPPVGASPRA